MLRSIDLKISAGEIVALIGRSGSGKSTLLHIISGLMKPSDGAVRIDGQRVEKPSPRWVMMFQAPSLYPWMTVAQNAGLGLKYAKKTEGVDARVKEVLSLVDLAEFADRNVQDLSGGQQQRAAFARSIAPEPELLLLDEPFSALDIFTRRALQNDVREIAKRLGLTVVLVTHDVNEAVQMADRAVLLSSGPGRIAGDTEINVSEADRVSQSKKFQMETTRLRTLYTEIAGLG
ncbi:ABC transporter ATP-binding protein [Aliishimia ponticola]|uniref:ABC transporter ATP-binding protein n=1 Tax=Aliishimia ponticola TaxID=2499833 RepID=UPI001B3B8B45|nr:ABC transporter ATP-binding protein [Aliishimia ponticola]